MNQAERLSYPWTAALAQRIAASGRRIGALFLDYAEARGRAAAVRQLQQLSDHTLRDIGLHRSQIRSAVYGDRL